MKPYATVTLHQQPGFDPEFPTRALHRQVEKWAEDNGLTIAHMQRDDPRGMMPAAVYEEVSKWRNLTTKQQQECVAVARFYGTMAVIEVRVPLSEIGSTKGGV